MNYPIHGYPQQSSAPSAPEVSTWVEAGSQDGAILAGVLAEAIADAEAEGTRDVVVHVLYTRIFGNGGEGPPADHRIPTATASVDARILVATIVKRLVERSPGADFYGRVMISVRNPQADGQSYGSAFQRVISIPGAHALGPGGYQPPPGYPPPGYPPPGYPPPGYPPPGQPPPDYGVDPTAGYDPASDLGQEQTQQGLRWSSSVVKGLQRELRAKDSLIHYLLAQNAALVAQNNHVNDQRAADARAILSEGLAATKRAQGVNPNDGKFGKVVETVVGRGVDVLAKRLGMDAVFGPATGAGPKPGPSPDAYLPTTAPAQPQQQQTQQTRAPITPTSRQIAEDREREERKLVGAQPFTPINDDEDEFNEDEDEDGNGDEGDDDNDDEPLDEPPKRPRGRLGPPR